MLRPDSDDNSFLSAVCRNPLQAFLPLSWVSILLTHTHTHTHSKVWNKILMLLPSVKSCFLDHHLNVMLMNLKKHFRPLNLQNRHVLEKKHISSQFLASIQEPVRTRTFQIRRRTCRLSCWWVPFGPQLCSSVRQFGSG